MSLDYFLFCKKRYQTIIQYLDDIIEQYDNICEFSTNENLVIENQENEDKDLKWMNPNFNRQLFIAKKYQVIKLLNICDKNIENLSNSMPECVHEYIDDYIDIDIDISKKITYCKICHHTK